MKRIVIIIVSFLIINNLICHEILPEPNEKSNFYIIKNEYLKKFKDKNIILENDNDGEQSKFKRWEYLFEPRTFPSGNFPKRNFLWNEIKKIQNQLTIIDTNLTGDWHPLESSEGFPKSGYSGRLDCIAFHPKDSNIIFVGSPSGGLWKSTTGGNSWNSLTDNLPCPGISEIVINYENPDIIYIATGDRDGANFISNPYSYGVLKSTNGGKTWDTTGLSHLASDQLTIQRLVMHPTNPNILMAATTGVSATRGLWRTTDAGKSWKNVSGGAKYTLEFNPANPNIVYSSGWKYLIRSTDAGATWNNITIPDLPSSNITSSKLAVTPANPHLVIAQFMNPNTGNTYCMYKSVDDGISWSKTNNSEITLQGGYDWVLAISPIDENLIFYGGQHLYYSTDGGINRYAKISGHVDHHALNYRPGSNVLYNCNDGGLYKSYDDGSSWINLNQGLNTLQYYRLSTSFLDETMVLTGAQDNGIQLHKNYNKLFIGAMADGMESIIDYTNSNIYYSSYQYGYLSMFGGTNNFSQPPGAFNSNYFAWVTPFLMHPKNPLILLVGGKEIYKTTNQGSSWSPISNQLTSKDGVGGGFLRSMAISQSNPDSVIYATSYVVVYKTTNGGSTWDNITSNLPTSAGCFNCSALSSIIIHPENQNIAWVTLSGYNDSNKVYKTTNGGAIWSNISYNLPSIPVNSIVYEKGSKDNVYIGTDIGVFHLDSTKKNWTFFNSNMPIVPIQELEIHYPSKKLIAATFGRGLWESSLYGNITNIKEQEFMDFSISPNPASDFIYVSHAALDPASIEIFNIFGEKTTPSNLSGLPPLLTEGGEKIKIDISNLAPGVYFIKIGDKFEKFVKW